MIARLLNRLFFVVAFTAFVLHKLTWLLWYRLLTVAGRLVMRGMYYGGWTELSREQYREWLRVNGG